MPLTSPQVIICSIFFKFSTWTFQEDLLHLTSQQVIIWISFSKMFYADLSGGYAASNITASDSLGQFF